MTENRCVRAGRTVTPFVLAMLLFSGCAADAPPAVPRSGTAASLAASPQQALALLQDGNQRFVQGRFAAKDLSAERRHALTAGQAPFAVIVCCSDSRVTPELIFDQGLGDIFIVRVAGNVTDAVVLGSVEYGVEHLHAPLVVVLGHEHCGAVQAAVEGGEAPGQIEALVAKIRPSVRQAQAEGLQGAAAVARATDLNVQASCDAVGASPVVAHLVTDRKVIVVGAKYHLGSGQVEWLVRPQAP